MSGPGDRMLERASVVLETVEGAGIRFIGRVESGAEVELDSGPGKQGVTPVENLLLSLAGCAGMDVIGILRKKRQVVLGYEVVVQGGRRDEHPRVFTRIEVIHRVRGRNLDPAAIQDAIRLSDTKYCTVYAQLAAGVPIESRFEILPA